MEELLNMCTIPRRNIRYSGEHKRFNFEHYVTIQKDQHYILEGLKEHGHVGIDARSQVRHLIEGRSCYDLSFDCIKLGHLDSLN